MLGSRPALVRVPVCILAPKSVNVRLKLKSCLGGSVSLWQRKLRLTEGTETPKSHPIIKLGCGLGRETLKLHGASSVIDSPPIEVKVKNNNLTLSLNTFSSLRHRKAFDDGILRDGDVERHPGPVVVGLPSTTSTAPTPAPASTGATARTTQGTRKRDPNGNAAVLVTTLNVRGLNDEAKL